MYIQVDMAIHIFQQPAIIQAMVISGASICIHQKVALGTQIQMCSKCIQSILKLIIIHKEVKIYLHIHLKPKHLKCKGMLSRNLKVFPNRQIT